MAKVWDEREQAARAKWREIFVACNRVNRANGKDGLDVRISALRRELEAIDVHWPDESLRRECEGMGRRPGVATQVLVTGADGEVNETSMATYAVEQARRATGDLPPWQSDE